MCIRTLYHPVHVTYPSLLFKFSFAERGRENGKEREADGGVEERRKIDEPIGIKFGGRNDCQAK